MPRSIFCLLLIWLIGLSNAFGQQKDVLGFGLAIDPAYWFKQGFRADIEKRVKDNHWLVGSIFLYNGIINTNGNANADPVKKPLFSQIGDSMSGFGFELQHKIFLGRTDLYFAYAPVYKNYNIHFRESYWHTQQIDGMEYYIHEPVQITQKIHRAGLSLIAGKRMYLSDYFVLDIHMGGAYKHSFVNAKVPGFRSYKRNAWDFAYSGFHPVLGFKMGFFL